MAVAYVYCVVAGLLAGVVGGLFGVAGGIVIVPFLVLALKLDQHTAQGTSDLRRTITIWTATWRSASASPWRSESLRAV